MFSALQKRLPGPKHINTLKNWIPFINKYCSSSANSPESDLIALLRARFPDANGIEVQDISGGCGSMYEVWVEDKLFKGLNKVKQHRLITETLKKEIKDMHGLRISTTVPEDT